MVLVPLIVLAQVDAWNRAVQSSLGRWNSLSDEFRGIEGIEGSYGSDESRTAISDLEPLVIAFAVAITVFLMVRRRLPSRSREFPRMVPT
jgi:hypothetical protein